MILVDVDDGDVTYEDNRGGHKAIIDDFEVRPRDTFEFYMVPQCSTWCHTEQFGKDIQLEIICSQWVQGVKVKEDRKAIEIVSDIRKKIYSGKRTRANTSSDDEISSKRKQKRFNWS